MPNIVYDSDGPQSGPTKKRRVIYDSDASEEEPKRRRCIDESEEDSYGDDSFIDDGRYDEEIPEDLFPTEVLSPYEKDLQDCTQWMENGLPTYGNSFFYNYILFYSFLNNLITFGSNKEEINAKWYHRTVKGFSENKCCMCHRKRALTANIFKEGRHFGKAGAECVLKMRLAVLYFNVIDFFRQKSRTISPDTLAPYFIEVMEILKEESLVVTKVIAKKYSTNSRSSGGGSNYPRTWLKFPKNAVIRGIPNSY